MNFMDYTDDAGCVMFTKGQVYRMVHGYLGHTVKSATPRKSRVSSNLPNSTTNHATQTL
jgi:hypothetical protein